MDPVRRYNRPALRRPHAIVAFEGWNDAGDAASGAVAFLMDRHEPEAYAVIDPEEFYDFQVHRPEVSIADGGTRRLTWPTTRFMAVDLPEQPRDLVLVAGQEPNLRWKTYARTVAQVLSDTDVELVITLGAFVGQVAHTSPVPVTGVTTDPGLTQGMGLLRSNYEGPTGIVGVLLEACRELGLPAVSLWAATPHYLAANPNPKAMLALVRHAGRVAGVELEVDELATVAAEFVERVDTALDKSDELREYVLQLEQDAPIDPSIVGVELISEIEQFLRDR